MTVEIKEIS